MLEIVDLTYRIAGRTLLDSASASIASGWKVGLVGRNGTGKSTLLRLIAEEAQAAKGAIRLNRGARLGFVAQELPASETPLIELVLAADLERAALLAEAETAHDPHRIADIQLRLADIDAHSAEARAAAILTGLGFAQTDLARPAREFSGGWRMRAALAGVLFSTPDLLALDEPTNYLDLEGASWLESFLRKYPHTVLIVSHDRELLNRSVSHILALADAKLELFTGGYDAYLARRAERMAQAGAFKAKQDAERARLQAFVDRFRAKASKAAQAQSRVKRLEKMQEVAVPLAERTQPFPFEAPEPLASPILEIEEAALGYAPGQPVLRNVSFRLDQDDRIVIVGPNGQGKTTLVKSLAGRLPLLAGGRKAARALRVGYFSQDQLDELRAGESVLAHIQALDPKLGQAQQRALAARFGFGPQKVDTTVERLSGGEKVRLLLGMMTYSKPHLIILDEPTSHLDIDSREALIHAVNGFDGAVLLITHDVYLAEACADRLWLVHNGRAQPYEGDLSDYRALVLAADRPDKRKSAGKAPRAGLERAPEPPARGLEPLKKRIAQAEALMAKAQAALAQIDAQLADPALFRRDPERGAQLAQQRAEIAAAAEKAESVWLETAAELEQRGGP
jgi:ATP-binding cassette subfamily F protein 3